MNNLTLLYRTTFAAVLPAVNLNSIIVHIIKFGIVGLQSDRSSSDLFVPWPLIQCWHLGPSGLFSTYSNPGNRCETQTKFK